MDPQPAICSVQERALAQLARLPSLAPAKLCGGTALARCHLHHRVSYDLDFFLPAPFDPVAFARQIKAAGLKAQALDVIVDDRRANQWHGIVLLGKERLKVSAVEDAYFEVYPAIQARLGDQTVVTESIEGLYHRKLLTITHAGGDGRTAHGGRQTARDLFDLWVLSQAVAPLGEFMARVPYDYPRAAFEDGLYEMPWFELIPQFKEIMASASWMAGTNMETVRRHLFAQLGIDVDALLDEAAKDTSHPTPGTRGARP